MHRRSWRRRRRSRQRVLDLVLSGRSVFFTGCAGALAMQSVSNLHPTKVHGCACSICLLLH